MLMFQGQNWWWSRKILRLGLRYFHLPGFAPGIEADTGQAPKARRLMSG